MPKRIASLLFARFLAVFGLLVLVPLFLSACVWFLSHTDISFFISTQTSFAHFTSSSRAWWILYSLGGPILAVMLLGVSLALEHEQGIGTFSRTGRHFILIAVGILLLPLVLGLCIHAILGT